MENRYKSGDIISINPNGNNAKFFKLGLNNLEIRSVRMTSLDVWESNKKSSWSVHYDEIIKNVETDDYEVY